MASARQKARIWNGVETILVLLAGLIVLTPILWIGLAAFKTSRDVFQLKFIFTPTLENFVRIFESPFEIHKKLVNSAIVAAATVALAIPLATCAAYSFSRFRLVGERLMLITILATQFVPAVVIVLPFFLMFRDFGILDTKLALDPRRSRDRHAVCDLDDQRLHRRHSD